MAEVIFQWKQTEKVKEKHKIREASKFTRISANKPYMIGTIRKKHRWLLLIYLCAHSMSFAHTNTLYMSVRTSFEHSPYCTLHYLQTHVCSLSIQIAWLPIPLNCRMVCTAHASIWIKQTIYYFCCCVGHLNQFVSYMYFNDKKNSWTIVILITCCVFAPL